MLGFSSVRLQSEDSLSVESRTHARPTGSPPEVRGATLDDIPAITRFLHGFWPQILPAAWRSLFDYDWIADKPDKGFVLTDASGAIAGFLATIYADRDTPQGRVRVCNVSSWAVLPEHRACAMMLIREVLSRRDCTITNLSPSREAQAFFLRVGFDPLEDAKLAWLPFGNAETLRRRAATRIEDDPVRVAELLDARGRRIQADHPRCRHLVVEERGAVSHLVRIVRRKRGVRVSEILYCSDSALLARTFERVKLHILRRDRTVALVSDRRLLGENAPRGLRLKRNACFRSSRLGAADIDNLYSEYALLPM
jgi:acetoacetyl-CoA synthetase